MERRWKVLTLASAGAFLAFLDATIVNVAFPDIRRSFPEATLSGLSWVLSAYNIVFAALLVPAGRLADLVGHRRMFVAGLAVFSLASLLCAVAPSPEFLVAARILQAAGGAALIPTSVAFVLSEFPATQRAMAVGLWGAAAAIAAAIGPSLGGLLIEAGNWRFVFVVNLPVGIVAVIWALRLLAEHRQPAGTPLPDFVGVVLITLGVGLLALGIVQGPDWGWGDARVVGSFIAATALIPLFARRCARHPSPVVELTLFKLRSFSVANVGTLLFSAAFYGMLLCHVLFLTAAWGYSVLDAGLAMSPAPLMAAVVAGPAGRIADRFGQRVVAAPGAVLFAVGNAWFATQVGPQAAFLSDWLPGALITGAGVGLAYPAFGSAAVAALPDDRYATGSAINAMFRQVGGALGISIVVAILQAATRADGIDPFVAGWRFCAFTAVLALFAALSLGRVRVAAAPVAATTDAIVPRPRPSR
jgi:EmrB/QacA subfamily drug resistance transporter